MRLRGSAATGAYCPATNFCSSVFATLVSDVMPSPRTRRRVAVPLPEPERALCGDWLRERLHIFEHPGPATGRAVAKCPLFRSVQFRVILEHASETANRLHRKAVK